MQHILLPTRDGDIELPEGMVHPTDADCPFAGLSYARGRTCCSLDATAAAGVLRTLGFTSADDLLGEMDAGEALRSGLALRGAYVNLLVFHRLYAEGNRPHAHPLVGAYGEARARGAEYPDWPFDVFAAALKPLGLASDWLVLAGEGAYGIREARSGAGRG